MARPAARLLLVAAVGFALPLLGGCGDRSHLIAPRDASFLQGELDDIEVAVQEHRCERARTLVQHAIARVEKRRRLDDGLRENLLAGLRNLAIVADRDCREQTTETETTPTETEPTETQPTETETQPTETTQTETTQTDTTPTDTTPTDTTTTDQGGGTPGNGNGNGKKKK